MLRKREAAEAVRRMRPAPSLLRKREAGEVVRQMLGPSPPLAS